jgi:hypothetical protein
MAAADDGVTPARITMFTAEYNQAQQVVNLRWSTASETDNERFIIERSVDSLHFIRIGETKSAGNSKAVQYYYFDDPKPVGGKLYYRLHQVDEDGKEYLSAVVSTFKPITNLELTGVHFSPYEMSVSFAVISPKTSVANVVVANVKGNVLKSSYLKLSKGATYKTIYTGDLKPGIYFLQVNDKKGGGSVIEKFSKE